MRSSDSLDVRSRRRPGTAAASSLALCLLATLAAGKPAHADDAAALNQYGSSERYDDGFSVSRPGTPGHLVPGVNVQVDYANDPLVIETSPGDSDSEAAAVVKHLMTSHVGLSLGLGSRLMLFGGFRAALINAGDFFPGAPQADGRGLGDSYLGGRLRLLGDGDDLVSLGGQLTVNFPTADLANSDQRFTGDSFGSIVPEGLLELRPGRLRINATAGARLREAATFENVKIGQELLFTLGLTYAAVRDVLDLHAEVYGATTFAHFFERESTPLEALGGLKGYFGQCFSAGASAGLGVLRGYGSPDMRFVGTLGWEACPPPEMAPLPPEAPPVIDTDLDGMLDPDDGCPFEAEDKDGFEDADGCPDPDNDKDGVLDTDDACVDEPEDQDGFEDGDGCPDPDNDGDLLPDSEDKCPDEAEDADGFHDTDGCPDLDNDRDGVLDAKDKCPLEPGSPDEQGCPKTIRVEEGRIVILDKVEFASGKDRILPRSEPILDEVKATLQANDGIPLLRIEGHTDSRGRDRRNLELSRRRARSVARYLLEHGVEHHRLEAYGCGETRPIADNRSAEGRQSNRRVEFHILDGQMEPPSVANCQEIELQ